MFEVGDQVIYGTEGVCRVERVEKLRVSGQAALYYVLSPVYREGATVYVPLDNERLTGRMKRVLSTQELETLLAETVQTEPLWIDNPNERKQLYSAVLLGGDRQELLRLVRTLYLHREKLIAHGKHLRAADDQALRDAERMINGEFAVVLSIPRHEVPAYIRARLEQAV